MKDKQWIAVIKGSINAVNQAVNFLLNHLLKGGLS